MRLQTLVGKQVIVSSARGDIARTIVAECDDVVVLAESDAAEIAIAAGVTRYSIGFRRSDILSIIPVDMPVLVKHNIQYEQVEHGQAGPDRSGTGRRQ